jgi:outer membrane protein TolC
MQLSSLKALPSRPRLPARHLSPGLIACAVATLLVLPVARADQAPPLALDEALRLASDRSAQIAAQRSAIDSAQQASVSARQLPDPKLFFGVENLPVNTSESFSLTQDFMTMRKIGLMQDFPRSEKRDLKGKLAEQVAAREQSMLGDVQLALRRDVAGAWIERYFAQRMAAVVDEQIAEVQLQADAMQAGLASGKAQPAELLAVQLNLQALQDKRADFDKQGTRAKVMLSRWLGDAAARPLAPFALPAVPTDRGALADHLVHHPHLQSLEHQVQAAQADASLAQASVKPDWSLEFAYAQRGPSFSNMISVQVTVDLPLFRHNRQNRDIASKVALIEQARDLKEEALRQHLSEERAAWVDWDSATARLQRFDDSLLPLSHERTQAALAAYRGGRSDLAPVLQARRDELDIKLQSVQLAADQARAYAQLLYFLPEAIQ